MRGQCLMFVCLSVAEIFSSCESRNTFVPPPPPIVTVARPIRRPVQEYFETTGQTRAVAAVDLRARVGGYLKDIKFKDGQLVEKDAVLFIIDKDSYQAAVASAEASLAKAEAQSRLAGQQLERTRHLAENDAAPASDLELHVAEMASSEADVAAAEAALRDANLNLEYTEIHAPFAGRIGRHQVDIGNLVVAGETLLASVETVDPIYAYFTLSETDLLRFTEMQKEGKLRKISEADPPKLDLALGDTGNFAFHGKLDFREFGIDPATGTTERRAVFLNPDVELVPGLFVRLRAAIGDPQEQLLVDERAIGSDQRGDYLLVVNDKNMVETRLVKLGTVDNGMRVIESGIQPQDRVIVNGLLRARPGSEVNPQEEGTKNKPPTAQAKDAKPPAEGSK